MAGETVDKEVSEVSFVDISAEHGGVRFTWTWLGEGWDGDYDADDPKDEPLLRFDVNTTDHEEGHDPRKSEGWCTAVDLRKAKRERLEAVAKEMAEEFAGIEASWRGRAAEFSHVTAEQVNEE